MAKYKHLFFDLDKTLWDFDTNVGKAMLELHVEFELSEKNIDPLKWMERYRVINKLVWQQYEERKLTKAELRVERFSLLLKEFNSSDANLPIKMSEYFLAVSPFKSGLMPNTMEVLTYLSEKYSMYIISNGFLDVQEIKMKSSKIDVFFEKVFTSDRLKVAKPKRKIFEESLKPVNARKNQSLMIGDNFEKDIIGARNFGIDQVWYNHEEKDGDERGATFEIKDLLELKTFL